MPTSDATRWPTWQPIETAPRDATAILVMRDIWPGNPSGRAEDCNGHNTYVAEWWSAEGPDGAGAWICYMHHIQDPECPIEPTHWMPLPPPPMAGVLDLARGLLAALTDEQRIDLFRDYCRSCGSNDPRCQCWNDE